MPATRPISGEIPAASELESYQAILGLRARSLQGVMDQALRGLEFKAAERLRRHLDVSLSELADIIQMAPRTMQRRRQSGRLHPDESDRVLRASRLYGQALELFEGNEEAARLWLAKPQRALGGRIPLEVAKTDIGARQVENLIGRLEHGVFT